MFYVCFLPEPEAHTSRAMANAWEDNDHKADRTEIIETSYLGLVMHHDTEPLC